MKKINLIMVAVLFLSGILSVTGYLDFVGKNIEMAGLLSFFNEFSINDLADTKKLDCSDGNCSKNKPVPIAIWLICCCIIGLTGYSRRKINV